MCPLANQSMKAAMQIDKIRSLQCTSSHFLCFSTEWEFGGRFNISYSGIALFVYSWASLNVEACDPNITPES
jgi:hypothetical protein